MKKNNDAKILLTMPAKLKTKVQQTATQTGMSTNEYIRYVLRRDTEIRKKKTG